MDPTRSTFLFFLNGDTSKLLVADRNKRGKGKEHKKRKKQVRSTRDREDHEYYTCVK
uniref:Uncharacterized protein n=1 Tax=Arundo donax TaxID=35708 RepID=A0A0A9EVA2_ARUDO